MTVTIILKYNAIFTEYFIFTIVVSLITGVYLVSTETWEQTTTFGNLSHVLEYLESKKLAQNLVVRELLSDFEKMSLFVETHKNSEKERYPFIAVEGMEMSGSKTLIDKIVDELGGTLLPHPPVLFQKYEDTLKNTTLYYPFRFLMLYATSYGVHNMYRKMPVMVDSYFFDTFYSMILNKYQNNSMALMFGHQEPKFGWPPDLMKPDINFYVTIDEVTRMRRAPKSQIPYLDNAPRLINNIMNTLTEKPVVLDGSKAIRNVLLDALILIRSKGLL